MTSAHISGRRVLAVTAAFAATALVLAGCAGNANSSSSGSNGTLTVGTTDKITSIDPAGSYDNGSFAVMNQVYPFLLNSPYGTSDVKPDIAESASFTSPTEYTVKLKPGLKFANGHDLTSSDVKFSFDRQIKINSPV
ncbi:MAG TPA: ABC transporter substrate-binding protein, partial [Diaminobutyricibacter sp.]